MSTTTASIKPLPFFYIGQDLTQTRIDNFMSQKHGSLSTALGKDDTKSIWYTREHVARLLDEIDYNGGDGLRVYFGAYEEGNEFEGQLCLVMYVTRQEGSGEFALHPDVKLDELPDFEDRSAQPRPIILSPGVFSVDGDPKDFNYGTPCPPRCSGSEG